MTTSSALLEADPDGALTASGGHFRRDFIDAAPHGDYSRPQPLDGIVLDVLVSDSPLQRGERILYRELGRTVEYRVLSVRSRRRGSECVSAALLERTASLPTSPAGTRPQRCLDRGVDGDGPTPSELESLRDIYMAAGMDDSTPVPDHLEPESRMDLLAGRVVDMVACGDDVLEEPRRIS